MRDTTTTVRKGRDAGRIIFAGEEEGDTPALGSRFPEINIERRQEICSFLETNKEEEQRYGQNVVSGSGYKDMKREGCEECMKKES